MPLSITAKLPQHHSVSYWGIPIVIEWPKNSVREGKDKDGRIWRREMKADYGFIDDTSAAGDAEPLDIYIGDDRKQQAVYVIEQLDESSNFDEFKLVTGVPDLESAQQLYLSHYPKEWGEDRLGDCYETDLDSLRRKVEEHQEEGNMNKTAGDEKIMQLWNSVKGTEDDQAGTALTGFYGDGPATCMDCIHRTPHSKDENGEEQDSCNHKLVKLDPELAERRLPDGTIKVDADDWCRFAQKPKKEEGESPGKPASRQEVQGSRKNPVVGAIYLRALASLE